jgi:hypothetical protein
MNDQTYMNGRPRAAAEGYMVIGDRPAIVAGPV